MSLKILITGANGFLGANLTRQFFNRPETSVILTSRNTPLWLVKDTMPFFPGNLLDERFVEKLLVKENPDIVINTVSLVNVDLCEENPDLARQITVDSARILAKAAKKTGSRMVHISTDQVFDGEKSFYTEEDMPNPINQYGKTKLEAEHQILRYLQDAMIIRTNFFGWSPCGHAPTFGEWVYQCLYERKVMQLFTNFYFSPIEVTSLAGTIDSLISTDFAGILHVCGSERCSKFDFGVQLAKETGFDPSSIVAYEMDSSTLRAKRPKDMSLSVKRCESLLHTRLPTLQESIEKFVRGKTSFYEDFFSGCNLQS
ncbi:SDR family oxidoreductase [Methanoregula formicica]|uniref:dTDP-4-dehydrorhamnose reductase n=1 Tax=Methanoregula formicica (strain DSM 22288 / NBRC 105244 / SMSP) TaxID=593750 RepID=L0HC77_METFS|nr:SDR family oxidoreductase [Methanoregula formicica]AGB02342.1 dTDP-4-dehydrorhamnose reductase [Methanoregula formicica SMSP]